jgi:hypothetical protein
MLLELIALICAGLFAGAAIYITLVKRAIDRGSTEAAALLIRWGRLHAVRTAMSGVSFGVLAWHLARPG